MFKMKALQAGVGLALVAGAAAVSAQAATITVNSLSITGGSFTMNASAGGSPNALTGGPGSPLVTGTYQGGTTPVAGGPEIANTAQSLTEFNFGSFGPVYSFTAASAYSAQAYTTAGTTIITGGTAPSGTVDSTAGTIAMNMSSWFADWNGDNFNQGNAAVTGTYTASTGAYSMTWNSLISGGPFNGNTGTWTLTGVVNGGSSPAPVPLPATVWLMGSGLLGLVGVARRKQKGPRTGAQSV